MSFMSRTVSLLALGLASSASAQSFNIDIGTQPAFSPVPGTTYGAAAMQPGTWNSVAPILAAPAALVDLTGALSGVSLSQQGGVGAGAFDNPGTTGDDQALLDDYQDIGPAGTTTSWSFQNLATGDYTLFTYAWSPQVPPGQVSVTGGTISPPQTCGGPWPGMHVMGTTYTTHHFSVVGGSIISVTITVLAGSGGLGGMQLVQAPPPGTSFCFGDGTGTPCAAGNLSPPGQGGCLNSLGMAGRLEVLGNPSITADSLLLHGSGMPFGTCLYFQGNNLVNGGAGVVFGDGLLCTNGTIVRLGVEFNGHGMSEYPGPGEQPVSVKGMVMMPGFKYYEVWYRDAAVFGTTATFNTSQTVCIPWVP
jgi:hypothetical protein